MTDELQLGLAATKLRPPEPPIRLVRRSRLDEQLDSGTAGRARLLLVSAPAGSGKSTLVASWLADRPGPVAWLQVEESDSDAARFWSALVGAIARTGAIGRDALGPVVSSSNGDELVVVPALVNELADLADPLIVVIDDYHLVDNAGVHRGMERLVDLCPAEVTIVMSTRRDPPFRLGRLRLREKLVEVRQADLRFDAEESLGLLGPAGSRLDPPLLEQLCGRAEGWAAGLVLAGMSLERASDPAEFVESFRGDDQLVVEYLRDELLAAVGEDDRRRLLQTSVLEQLTGPLVDAVTDSAGGAAWLRDTAGSNQLLIGLDRTGTWYRYHHLLRDLLRAEAQQQLPDELVALHLRAARWFESEGDHRQAVTHRIAAGDAAGALPLMRVFGIELLRSGQTDSLRNVLVQLGDAARTDPACALLRGWCEFIAGRYSLAETWLDTALEVAPDGFDQMVLTPLRINISLARGDVATAFAVAERLSATDDLGARTSDLVTAVGAAHAWAGRGDGARSILRVAVDKAVDEGTRSSQLLALVYLAIVELEFGSPASARTAASAALEVASEFGLSSYHGVAPAFAIRARTGSDPAGARADALHAVELARRASTELALGYVLTTSGDTLLDLDDSGGRSLLSEARSVVDRCPDPGTVGRSLARAESRHGVAAVRTDPVDGLVEPLTERELAVLRYLPTALSQRDIASELYVSLNTVKTHCRSIYRKLGVGDRKAAVQAARDRHVV